MTAATGGAFAHPGHILDLLEPWLRPGSAAPAVVDPAGSLTYGELDGMTRRIAADLRGQGLSLGDPVIVHARLSGWAVVALLAVLRAGGRYVPVDAAFPIERQRRTYQLSGAKLVLAEPGVPPIPGPWRTVEVGPATGAAPPPDRPARGPDAYTYFTSGTTGQAKPVTVPAAALAYSTAARLAYYPDPVEGFLLCSSIAFDSSVAGIFWTLAGGGRLIIPSDRPANLLAVRRAAVRHRPSHLLMVPSLYGVLLRSADPAHLAGLTAVVVAGEVCPPALVARHFAVLPDTALYNEYGPTECTVWSTVHRCAPADGQAPTVPIGAPIPGTTVTLRTPQGGTAVPPGAIGEIWIDGPGVASGSGPYRSGDLASVGPDGLLRFHGRADEQLKLGGVRIELAEIEQALTGHPDITAGAVGRSVADPARAQLVAFVVADQPVDTRALRAHLLARLPAVAVPARYVVLDRLPTQPNGKLDRGALNRLASGH
ncbi:amino acid adenylation domain-containing protein [Micromonospora narathiwatensis]|uniref:Amino acid adenylation domain-containing protein n=1 Tax=Micromonospora narathiwatensis TaxID=299146 RepID=A0A1A8ZGF6_9ACTN|nr:amino acid adenylation domain-containing protein [Micromonospora narathiwatensis]SBT42920.1 amino acid adenylation domain-containing protein [Micromonospora narathiwatensis]